MVIDSSTLPAAYKMPRRPGLGSSWKTTVHKNIMKLLILFVCLFVAANARPPKKEDGPPGPIKDLVKLCLRMIEVELGDSDDDDDKRSMDAAFEKLEPVCGGLLSALKEAMDAEENDGTQDKRMRGGDDDRKPKKGGRKNGGGDDDDDKMGGKGGDSKPKGPRPTDSSMPPPPTGISGPPPHRPERKMRGGRNGKGDDEDDDDSRPPPPTGASAPPPHHDRRMRGGRKGKGDDDDDSRPPPPTGASAPPPHQDRRMQGDDSVDDEEIDMALALLKVCEGLAKMAEEAMKKGDKRSLDMLFEEMKDVCMEAVTE